jgi:hypothetical protein
LFWMQRWIRQHCPPRLAGQMSFPSPSHQSRLREIDMSIDVVEAAHLQKGVWWSLHVTTRCSHENKSSMSRYFQSDQQVLKDIEKNFGSDILKGNIKQCLKSSRNEYILKVFKF